MKDSDLRFTILTAAALGVVIILGSSSASAPDWGASVQLTLSEHLGIRGEWEKFDQIGSSATGENDIQMWSVGLNYKF